MTDKSSSPSATLGEANWQRLVKRLRDMRAYGGRDYECMDDAADMIVQMADHIALLVAATSARSETPSIQESLDFNRLRAGDRRALFAEHQPVFNAYYAALESTPSAIGQNPDTARLDWIEQQGGAIASQGYGDYTYYFGLGWTGLREQVDKAMKKEADNAARDKRCASPAELAHFMAGLFAKCHELEFNGQTLEKMLDVEGYLRDQAALACAPSHAPLKLDLTDTRNTHERHNALSTTPRIHGSSSCEEMESMYHKVVMVAMDCDPISACDREDDRIEPPWEVFARMKRERDEARTALSATRQSILEEAARACEKLAERRFEEHGFREPDTNATYYGGHAAEEYDTRDEEDADCAAAIRALNNRPDGTVKP